MRKNLPNAIFKVGDKKYKFIRGQFIVPGVNKNQPITAEEALRNAKVLTYLVKSRSAVIAETNQLTPAEAKAAEEAKKAAEAKAKEEAEKKAAEEAKAKEETVEEADSVEEKPNKKGEKK